MEPKMKPAPLKRNRSHKEDVRYLLKPKSAIDITAWSRDKGSMEK
jgi:hypothetical protein